MKLQLPPNWEPSEIEEEGGRGPGQADVQIRQYIGALITGQSLDKAEIEGSRWQQILVIGLSLSTESKKLNDGNPTA